MLGDGRFLIHVPEEGALLVAAWLIERGETARAKKLIETIMPFFDRLRFYPAPNSRPLRSGTTIYLQTAGESVKALRARRPRAPIERMKEAVQVWTPLYDRAAALFLETVDGNLPSLRTDHSGALLRRQGGHPIVDGEWPYRRFANDWSARARQILADYEKARAKHQLCRKPEKPKENFARLRGYIKKCVEDPNSLTGRDVGMIRKILASHITRHGAPGSERLRRTRADQARDAARPMHHAIAGVVAGRLEVLPQDEGVPDVDRFLEPLSEREAARLGASAGEPIPPHLLTKARLCLDAPLETLVAQRLIPSSETLAAMLPLLTAKVRGSAIDDPELRRVYESVYTAFRQRRSLLLLDLRSQVTLSELPWISTIAPWVGADEESRRAAWRTLGLVASLAIQAFPYTLLPNKLVQELRALADGAGEPLSLVNELAADIFMGAFSAAFLRSAQVAARMLRGSLYERYYGLPYERVLSLTDLEEERFGTAASPGFAALCEKLAGVGDPDPRYVARSGAIIEQAQILTTHNLAALFDALALTGSMRPKLPDLAQRCFQWICRGQQLKVSDRSAQLHMIKNAAYAWRQMIFYLSLSDPSDVTSFLDWSADYLAEQRAGFRQRFAPAMAGLRAAVDGDPFALDGTHAASGGRRFLGWSIAQHWLLPPRDRAATG